MGTGLTCQGWTRISRKDIEPHDKILSLAQISFGVYTIARVGLPEKLHMPQNLVLSRGGSLLFVGTGVDYPATHKLENAPKGQDLSGQKEQISVKKTDNLNLTDWLNKLKDTNHLPKTSKVQSTPTESIKTQLRDQTPRPDQIERWNSFQESLGMDDLNISLNFLENR